jgi:predicted kinase
VFAVVVSGLPGTGKTTLSVAVAKELGVPVIGKDLIKETLADSFAATDIPSRAFGQAAIRVLYALAELAPEVVLESFFWPGVSEPDLLRLNRPLIQINCSCDLAVAQQRSAQRIARGERHSVRLDLPPDAGLVESGGRLALPGPTIDVDSTNTVDLDAVIGEIRSLLRIL